MIKYSSLDGVKPTELGLVYNTIIPGELKSIFAHETTPLSFESLVKLHSRRIGVNCLDGIYLDWNFAYTSKGLLGKRELVGYGLTTKLSVDDDKELLRLGWNSALLTAFTQQEKTGYATNSTYLGFFVQVKEEHRKGGVAGELLDRMKQSGQRQGASRMVIPLLLPSVYHRENLFQSIDDYGFITREDGHYQDHWLRLHTRLGARVLGTQECSHQYAFTEDEMVAIKKYSDVLIETDGDNRIVIQLPSGRHYGAEKHGDAGFYVVQLPCVWVEHPISPNPARAPDS